MKKMMVTLLAGAMLMMATSAMATSINGVLWTATGYNLSVHNLASISPTNTIGSFTVDQLNFDTRTYGDTYTKWLQGSSSNMNGLNWTSAAPSGFITDSNVATFFQFTGTGYFAANTKITHDDGVVLWLTSPTSTSPTMYDFSYPTSPQESFLGNTAGVYNFVLNYAAWNGFPEVLEVNIAPVPEPGTMMLLGIGLGGLAIFGKRRMNKEA